MDKLIKLRNGEDDSVWLTAFIVFSVEWAKDAVDIVMSS